MNIIIWLAGVIDRVSGEIIIFADVRGVKSADVRATTVHEIVFSMFLIVFFFAANISFQS